MAAPSKPATPVTVGRFVAYAAAACAVVAVFALGWVLRDVLLLAFGSVIFAVIIRAPAMLLVRRTRLRERWAVLLVVFVLLLLVVGFSWLFGQQISSQLRGLSERIPVALEELSRRLESNAVGRFFLDQFEDLDSESSWLESAPKVLAISATTVAHALLMVFVGIYLAANPMLYFDGLVRLFPTRHRRRLHSALLQSGDALKRWLLGQLVSMVFVGALTGIGLWIAGAPLPLALGILAGLLEFIPVVGPALAFLPGVLVAFTEGPQIALYAAIVFVVVQQLEGNVIMPLAQRWAVELPPAYGLMAIVAFALLFGFLGILFGTPLAVVVMCLVQQLYIRNGLEKHSGGTRSPGSHATES